MNIYFDRDSKSVSVAIHGFDKWIDFRLHKLWALHYYRGFKMVAVFCGPLMVSVGW